MSEIKEAMRKNAHKNTYFCPKQWKTGPFKIVLSNEKEKKINYSHEVKNSKQQK